MTVNDEEGLTRRRFGRAALLGGTAAGVAAVAGTVAPADAAATGAWNVTGNTNTNGTNFVGPKNSAPLIFKTANVERGRFKATGEFQVATAMAVGTTPDAYAYALHALTTNTAGTGVRGDAPNSDSGARNAIGVQGVGTTGVDGSGSIAGVRGFSPSNAGVRGVSTSGYGVYGISSSSYGVVGDVTGTGGFCGVYGQNDLGHPDVSAGVAGSAGNTQKSYSVWGMGDNAGPGLAGYFTGNVQITGTISKGAGSFKIDHPLDPQNKYLSHSFVESPDMMNVYNGNVILDKRGEAIVKLPDYFAALNSDHRYQLTPIGGPSADLHVARKIRGRTFKIAGGTPGLEVSWLVTGIRQDAFANAHRIRTVEDKQGTDRGKYLHAIEHGKEPSMGAEHAQVKAMRAALR